MPELVNSKLVNVIENTTEAFLNWYDDNTTWLNTVGNGVYFNPDMSYTFANAINMNLGMSDDWLGYFSFVTNMSHMAYDCRNLRGNPAVPPKVENMYRAFWNCLNLDKANVGPSVTNMTESFYHCNNIKTIDVGVADASNFAEIVFRNENNFNDYTNLSKVTGLVVSGKVLNMYRSFYNYPVLYAAPNCGQNVTNMMEAFYRTGVIGQPIIGNNVVDAVRAYYSCPNITGSVYTGKNTVNIYQAFENCVNIWGDANIGNLVTNASRAFYGCRNLKGNISVGRSVQDISYGFYGCSGLTNYILTPNVDSIENMAFAFYNCTGLKGSPMASKNALNIAYAYYYCRSLTGEAYIGPNVNNMVFAYDSCDNLERINFPLEMANNITNMTYSFDGCTNAKGVASIGVNTINAALAYWTDRNLDEFYVADNPNLYINMYRAFYNCVNAKGIAVARNGYLADAYRGCNNIVKINVNVPNTYNVCNVMFGGNTTTNLSNVTDIYFSDLVVNAANAFANFKTIKGSVNHSVEGQLGNNITNMSRAFDVCVNLTGDGYIGPNVVDANWAYCRLPNLNGNVYLPKGLNNFVNTRQCFEQDHKITGIYLDTPNSDNMYKWVFSTFYSDNNTANTSHTSTNLSNVKFIEVGDNVKTMQDLIDPVMFGSLPANSNSRMFAGYVTAGNNVTNMCRAFRGCYYLARDAADKTANVGPKVVNLDATFQYCYYIENAQCPNTVQVGTYAYYNCFNLKGNPAVSTGLKNTHNMYKNCFNLNGFIPEHLKYAKLTNSVNMFGNCVNLNKDGTFIVPLSDNYYNMYYGCHNTNIRNLDVYGCNIGSHCITWVLFGLADAPVNQAARNFRNVRFLSDTATNYGPLGSGAARVFKVDWYAGMENLYVDIPTAANFFPSDTGSVVDNVQQDNHYRSNNFVNVKNITFGPNVVNLYNFARRIYANEAFLRNLNVLDFSAATKLQNISYAFSNLRQTVTLTPFVFHNKITNTTWSFQNMWNLKMNLSECVFEDANQNVNMCGMFYNGFNLTGNPFCYNNATHTSQVYTNCRLLTGAPQCSNISINTRWMYSHCYNITGDAPCSPKSTDSAYMYRYCYNLTGNAGTPNTGNMVDMYRECSNMKGTINPNFIMSTSHNMNCMFYNCSNLTGPAYFPKGGACGNHWWSIYYNCRKLNGIEAYSTMGDSVHDMFATIFAQDGVETQPHIMNSDNLVYVNFYNTCNPYGDVWGTFRYLNNVHDWYIDIPNATGLMYKEYHYSNTIGDVNYMNRPMPTQAKGVKAVQNIVIGPSVTSLAYFMLLADNASVGANRYGTVNIDMTAATNVTNMSNAFGWSDINFGSVDLRHCTKLQNFMCAFERSNYIRECNLNGLDNITAMQYAFGDCKNLTGHAYISYKCANMYQAYMHTNINNAVIRPITGSTLRAFQGCNNLHTINIQPSASTTSAYAFADMMFGGANGNFGAVKTLTNLAKVKTLHIHNNVTNCAQLFRETNINCTPVFPRKVTNMYCSYYNCPNINPNIGSIYVDYTGALNMNCTFGGKLTPLVYGDVYLNTTATSGCDYIRGILIRNATTERTSTYPALNWHWKRGSHWDIEMKKNWLSQSIGCNDQSATVIAMDEIVDNGWHNTKYNIYIFNNYLG